MNRFKQIFESGLIYLWVRNDYMISLFGSKFHYETTDPIQDLKLDNEIFPFLIVVLFEIISSVVLLFEMLIFLLKTK